MFIKRKKKIKNLIYYDQLCGCYNRNYFELEIKTSDNWKNKYITIVDINEFKLLNDTYGHSVGDMALKNLVSKMSEMLNSGNKFPNDAIIRYGGDEFVILSDVTSFTEINDVLNKQYNISISYGTIVPQLNETIESAIDRADKLMYDMKTEYYNNKSKGNYSNKVLFKLQEILTEYSELRICQVLECLNLNKDLYYLTDEELYKALENFKNKISNKGGL